MSRAPAVNQGVVLPPPSAQYDAANEREARRLLEEALRRLMQWGAVTSVPAPVTALGAIVGAADNVAYFSGVSTMALASLTPYARTLIACINAAAARTVLGLGSIALLNTIAEGNVTLSDVLTLNVSSTMHGLAPKSPADATQFMNGAATPAYAQVKDSDLALSNVTTNDVSIAKHGFAPILPNDATKFLDGTGAYSIPSVGAFPPTLPTFPVISNLEGRFSAEPTISTLTRNTDGLLAQINDASGNWGSNFTATTNARPRWMKRAMNGMRPGIVFDGSASKLVAGATKTIAQPLTVVAVVQNWHGGAANGNIFRDSNSGPVLFLSGATWAIFAGTTLSDGGLNTQNTQALPDGMVGAPAIAIAVFNGASSTIANNGVEVTSNAGATGISGTMRIGGDSSTSFAHVVLYEILFFSKALSLAERGQINTYYATALDINL